MADNQVPDIGNDEARRLYTYIFRTLTDISGSWVIFKQLFISGDENCDLMDQAASNTFGTIQWAMYESVVLGISKLTDRAWFGRHENLSILRLQELLLQTHPTEVDQISAKWAVNCSRFEPLRRKRNKQIAHADRVASVELPCTKSEIDEALSGVIDIMRVIDLVFGQENVMWNEPIQSGDGESLLRVLKYWKASTDRELNGRAKYYSPLGEISPVLADKLFKRNMTGGNSVADDLVYQVYGYDPDEHLPTAPRKPNMSDLVNNLESSLQDSGS